MRWRERKENIKDINLRNNRVLSLFVVFLILLSSFTMVIPIKTEAGPSNSVPTNGTPSFSFDDGDNCYAYYKTYSISVTYTDLNGYADFDYVEILFGTYGMEPSTTYAEFKYDEDDNSKTQISGSSEFLFDTSGSTFIKNANTILATWKFTVLWNRGVQRENVGIRLKCYDDQPSSDTDDFPSEFDTVSTLVVYEFYTTYEEVTDNRVPVDRPLVVNYGIHYENDPGSGEPSAHCYPPDVEFAEVSVYQVEKDGVPGKEKLLGASANTINGAGTIDTTVESEVGRYTYRLYVDMGREDYNDDYLSYDIYLIADRIEIYAQSTNAEHDGRVNVGTSVTYTVSARLDYDNHALITGDALTSSACGALAYKDGTGWYVDVSLSSPDQRAFSISSGSETTYRISGIHDSVADPSSVIWDRIAINWGSEHNSMNAGESNEISLSSVVLDYDDTPIESYQYDVACSLNGRNLDPLININENNFNFQPKLAGTYSFTIDSFSGDNDYGITSYQANQTIDITVKQRFQLAKNINSGIGYITWGGANTTAELLAHDLGLDNDESIAVYNATTGSYQTWYVGQAGDDFTIHTYDVIMTQLETSNSIDVSLSPGDYQASKNVDLVDSGNNGGLNYFSWGNASDISMSTLTGASYLNLPVGYAVYRWDSATGTWDTYIKGITGDLTVTTYDTLITYVDADKNGIPIT